MRLSALILSFATLAPIYAQSSNAQSGYRLSGTTDRPDAVYAVGEEVQFQLQVTKDGGKVNQGSLRYQLDNDGVGTFGSGDLAVADQPLVIRGKLDQPGFLRCSVTYMSPDKQVASAIVAAAVDLEKIPPSMPVPEDFDSFWEEKKKLLAEIPADPKLTALENAPEGVEAFDVQIACLGDTPVSGYFARPAGAAAGSLPAILYVHGAGVRGSVLLNAINGAQKKRLSMDINAHGIPNGKPPRFYADLNQNELANYRFQGRENRDKCYFLGMFLRLIRAIDFLTAQPEWDGKHVIVIGHSQGGGQAIAAAGLDPRVTFFAAGVPAICDHSGMAIGRINGWPKLVPAGVDGKPDPTILEVARYFDGMNLATRTKADAIFSVGFIDVTCPPSSVYATYNNVQGNKSMVSRPLMGHATPADITVEFDAAIDRHLGR